MVARQDRGPRAIWNTLAADDAYRRLQSSPSDFGDSMAQTQAENRSHEGSKVKGPHIGVKTRQKDREECAILLRVGAGRSLQQENSSSPISLYSGRSSDNTRASSFTMKHSLSLAPFPLAQFHRPGEHRCGSRDLKCSICSLHICALQSPDPECPHSPQARASLCSPFYLSSSLPTYSLSELSERQRSRGQG